jgi:DNA-directed RNA polymerase subunit M
MMFCKTCGSILKPIRENGKTVFFCSKCNKKQEQKEDVVLKEKINEDREIVVISEEEDLKTYPLTKAVCKKCGHDKAHYKIVQTRSSDEAPTRFFICEKCKFRWREYN